MNEPILVIMAAGMGSRYGGLKQMDPVGPGGELILDYSLFDARRAGFKRVVFLIKHEIEADFRRIVGERIERHMDVAYAFQQLDALPAGFDVPEGRQKPWGTAHALLCCKEFIDAPFAAINADDYYGVSAFQAIYDYLKDAKDDALYRYAMVGYPVENTLTENGYVSRGVCTTDEAGNLSTITERTHIISTIEGALYTEDGETYRRIPAGSPVSMNLWGFTPGFIAELEAGFPAFLRETMQRNPLKGEYFLPSAVDALLQAGRATVRVLRSDDRWYGVTYREDKPVVMGALRSLAEAGVYPTPLWR